MTATALNGYAGSAYERVLDALEHVGSKVRRSGSGVTAHCPAHDDREASLSVSPAEGKVLLNCFARCDIRDITAGLGLTAPDLFDKPTTKPAATGTSSNGIVHLKDRQRPKPAAKLGREVATYTYTDAAGEAVGRVLRYDPKAFRQKRWNPTTQQWEWKGFKPVLYRLPAIVAAVHTGQVVYVVEGEKDVHAIESIGGVATTSPGGADSWSKVDASPLRGATVVIVADKDDAGRMYAADVAASLSSLEAAVTVVEALDGNDSADHIAGGHGLNDFVTRTAGELVTKSTPWPSPKAPMAVARRIVAERDVPLRAWRGGWAQWNTDHWDCDAEDAALRQDVYNTMEHVGYWGTETPRKPAILVPWNPNTHSVNDVVDALKACTYLPREVDAPSWLDDRAHPPADEVIACHNTLVHVATRREIPHTAAFFNRSAVPFDYNPDAPQPVEWLKFLDSLWPGDPESVSLLQEWFGYVLSGRTDYQKIMLIKGPMRSGKGTIARILTELIGADNLAAPSMSTLADQFGLETVMNKTLAIIADARQGKHSAQVLERLLTISGEDTVTVDRKNRTAWVGKIPARLLILTNEVPEFDDPSSAIASRFVVLAMRRSFLGHEDRDLQTRLITELPGILLWALDGLDRLIAAGSDGFTQPEASADTIDVLNALTSGRRRVHRRPL